MEAKFKVGDKVKVLPRDSNINYRSGYVDGMLKHVGKIATIIRCFDAVKTGKSFNDDSMIYHLDITDRIYSWNSSMLASLEETSSTLIGKILSQRFTNNKKIYKLNWKV